MNFFDYFFSIQLKQEINRCELLKSQTLQRQIQLARTKIVSLWDKCFVTVEERRAFIPFTEGQFVHTAK
jgi:hypothetical protein